MSTSTLSYPQITKVHDTLVEKGITADLLQNRLLGTGAIADLSEAAVAGTLPDRETLRKALGLTSLEMLILVNYGLSLEQMIAVGHYDWISDNITAKKFSVIDEGEAEYKVLLLHPNRAITSDEAERLIRAADLANPYEPAKIEHLLAFGAQYLDLQRQFPIIGLGSIARVHGTLCVPKLGRYGSGRGLYLERRDCVWCEYHRFLAVRLVAKSGIGE